MLKLDSAAQVNFLCTYFYGCIGSVELNVMTLSTYCLWILGNGATLVNCDSIWKKLVNDAKERECFYNADEDKPLAKAIMDALVVLDQLDALLNMDSLLFRNARGKVWGFFLPLNILLF